jgi:4-hydroxybenzoate polyprenyltransferase
MLIRGRFERAKRAYLELLRPANVVTAVADGFAGFAVTGSADISPLPWLLASSACLYAGGVALNDFFDRELDLRERPERPIPSGRVRPAGAAAIGAALLASGVLAASRVSGLSAAIALAAAALIVLYDAWGKHRMFFGPVNMGVCRGLNLLLGISAVSAAVAERWYLGLIPFIYICGVTALSRGEVHGGKRPVAAFSLVSIAIVLAALAALAVGAGERMWWALTLLLLFGWRVVPPFLQAYRNPGPAVIRTAIRTGVLSLVLLDAVIGGAFAGMLYSLLILATAILAIGLAKLFAVT